MPVDRTRLLSPFTKDSTPSWRCPSCGGGYFTLVENTLSSQWSAETKKYSKHPAFDHDWVDIRFTANLICSNNRCAETAVIAGSGKVDVEPSDDGSSLDYVNYFYPKYFYPSPELIDIPAKCPSEVTEQLQKAFILSWGDPVAAGNQIRIAVEKLLDVRRVRKTVIGKTGRRQRISLHDRIIGLEKSNSQLSQYLQAIKWIGNAGSHNDTLSQEDIYSALDIFEHVLDFLYADDKKNLGTLVRQVNKAKKPLGLAKKASRRR